MGMRRPAVSVILPAFNAQDTLRVAAHSILSQSLEALELLLVDDGSTDGTAEVMRALAREDARVRTLFCAHGGVVQASAAGLQAARAPYIARMDADDRCMPTRLALQSATLDAHPEVGVVSSLVAFGGERDKSLGYALYVDWLNAIRTHEEILRWRFVEAPIANPSVMFRRSLAETFGFYRDGDFPEDYELWLRWMEAGVRFAKIPETLLVWNDPPTRLSRCDRRYLPDAFHRCKAPYLARWLATHNPHHPRVMIWGAGKLSRKHSRYLKEHGIVFSHYIDVDPRKIGKHYGGVPVLMRDDLPTPGNDFIVPFVGARHARDDIQQQLHIRGFQPERDYIFAS